MDGLCLLFLRIRDVLNFFLLPAFLEYLGMIFIFLRAYTITYGVIAKLLNSNHYSF